MLMQKFADIPVNDIVREVLSKHLVVGGRPQTKDGLRELVLAQHNIRAQVRVIGSTFPGWGWDKAIETHVLFVITYELQQRDENEVRLYQCWPAGVGRYFWEPFKGFDLQKLGSLKRAATTRKGQAEAQEQRWDIWIEELQKRGGTVADVYTSAVARIAKAS